MSASIVTAAQLEARVREEMLPGGRFFPFSPDNFAEALAEASDADKAKVADYARNADHVALCAAMTLIADGYWLEYGKRLLETKLIEETEKARDNRQFRERHPKIFLQAHL